MGHIRVVACILDDACAGKAIAAMAGCQRKADTLAAWKFDLDKVWKLSGQQRGAGGFRRSRRASAGRPAATQIFSIRFHSMSIAVAELPVIGKQQ